MTVPSIYTVSLYSYGDQNTTLIGDMVTKHTCCPPSVLRPLQSKRNFKVKKYFIRVIALQRQTHKQKMCIQKSTAC